MTGTGSVLTVAELPVKGWYGKKGNMKTNGRRFFLLGLLVVTANALTHPAVAAPINSWISTADGKWETGSNWSSNNPPNSGEAVFITNTAPAMAFFAKTITIDSTTSGGSPGSMTVSNLTMSGPGLVHNTLALANAGSITPLRILNTLTITSGGIISITNSVLRMDGGNFEDFSPDDGAVLLNTGTLITTNIFTAIGYNARGFFTVLDGTWLAGNIVVGYNPGSSGTLSISGGTVTLSGSGTVTSNLQVGGPGATGTVWFTGGQLITTNGATDIGQFGVGQIIVSNGIWRAQDMQIANTVNSQGSLSIYGGSLGMVGPLTVGNGVGTGSVIVAGGILSLNPTATAFAGSGFEVDGSVVVNKGSSIFATNGTVGIGFTAGGSLSNLGGALTFGDFVVGNTASFPGSLVLSGGSNLVNRSLTIGNNVNATGMVSLAGGVLLVTNSSFAVLLGASGFGSMNVSSGTFVTADLQVGNSAGSRGVLTIAGGTNVVHTLFEVAFSTSATGTVWQTGGLLSNSLTVVGRQGVGQMTVSNGTEILQDVFVGQISGGQGTMTFVGGSSSAYSSFTLGTLDCTATGTVIMSGGGLFVTNVTHSAVLEVQSGTFTLNSGVVHVDKFVLTNSCAHFTRTGGTLLYTTVVLDPAGDADGDGIPNGYELAHGLDPLNPADASADNDGDGFSNLQEYLAGTDPNDPNSMPFRVTSITTTGANVRLTWATAGGTTNQVQATSGGTGGSYSTNNFVNLGPTVIVAGGGLVTTNFLDTGGATNKPARYYRVRLVP